MVRVFVTLIISLQLGEREPSPDNFFNCHCREACNQAFDRMPLAGVIDQDIFCVHGGIPRPVSSNPGATRVQDILAVPKVAGM